MPVLLIAVLSVFARSPAPFILLFKNRSLILSHRFRGREKPIPHLSIPGDEAGLRRLGVNLTGDPNFSTRNLFAG